MINIPSRFQLFILSVFFVAMLSCKAHESEATLAGLEFCNCIKRNAALGKEVAFELCHDSISKNYRLLKIYLDTRSSFINESYNDKTVDSVHYFIDEFLHTVDSCNPPFWLKK